MIIRRRDFITLLGGTAVSWPLAARGQQPAQQTVAFVSGRAADDAARWGGAFRKGLDEAGGSNVTVEYHWLAGRYEGLPALMADLVRRRVTVIATAGGIPAAAAAKAAPPTIPIVFAVAEDPVSLGLVASLARPGGNATGVNFFNGETVAKQLSLLHEMVPKAKPIAVLVNPANANAAFSLRALPDVAREIGVEIQPLEASNSAEIDAAFAKLAGESAAALLIAPDAVFTSRRVQIAIQAARNGLPTGGLGREGVEVGLLMYYGTDLVDSYRQVGSYAGRILKGARPTDLPVVQSTKFELLINLATAKTLGLTVPPSLIAIADEVIE
jgi:putative ABC transport system substrate-binding protein